MPAFNSYLLAVLGLFAGVLGGLAGIGGAMVMLPGLAFLVGYSSREQHEHHLYMAAAMIVTFLVAIPSAWRHHKNGNFRRDLFLRVVPGQVLGVVAGTLCSNFIQGNVLRVSLGVLIIVVVLLNLVREHLAKSSHAEEKPLASTPTLSGTSSVTGFLSGLSGLGGGALVIPALQLVGHVPLKRAIAVSSAMLLFSSSLGAILKVSTLGEHGQRWQDATHLALLMGLPAMVGAVIGAELTNRIPTKVLRFIVSGILLVAALRLVLG